MGGRAQAVCGDISDLEEVDRVTEQSAILFGSVDIVVGNAGAVSSGKSLLFTPIPEVEYLLRLNVISTLRICQIVLPRMRAAKRGDIVVISSVATNSISPKSGSYTMAKTCLETMAITMAKEEARHGIRVNVVAPGGTDTRIGRGTISKSFEARVGRRPTAEIESISVASR